MLKSFSKKRIAISSALLLLLLFVTIFFFKSFNSNDNNESFSNSMQQEFENYTNDIFSSEMAGDTLSMHFYISNPKSFGLESLPQTLGTFSYDSLLESQNYFISAINDLSEFEPEKLTQKQQITYDILLEYFRTELDFSDLCLCYHNLSPTTGVQAQLPVLFAEYDFNRREDVENYLDLLGQLNKYYRQLLDFQKIKAENNCFMSTNTCNEIIKQCSDFVGDGSVENNYLYESFNNKITKPELFMRGQFSLKIQVSVF